ncbi:ornithine cyclodeaminase family protein [Streptomyces sp. NPDC057474]|uniref:ornithine cyclodeaminase family protein n=1 Tax=Streptomyces sp. NPDC057474 TaxID=3346144 RepID=UPI0036BA02B6
METWVLSSHDIAKVVAAAGRDALMGRIIDRLAEGFAQIGRGERDLSPPRGGFERAEPVPGVFEWMPHRDAGDSITLKTVGYSPANPRRFALPTIIGTVARYDDHTGALTALMDGVLLTAMRTGAASAVASRLLARPGSRTLGLIGAGAQAVTQLHALSLVFELERVLVWDAEAAHRDSFARRAAFTKIPVQIADPARIIAECDIVTTATSVPAGAGPVLPDGPHREHLHINAVGADLVGKTELPLALLTRAFVSADHPEQARREGECQQLAGHRTAPGLTRLAAEPALARPWRERLSVFDSTGFAFEDALAMEVFLQTAAEHGLGRRLPIEHHPADALDPYALQPLPAGAPAAR